MKNKNLFSIVLIGALATSLWFNYKLTSESTQLSNEYIESEKRVSSYMGQVRLLELENKIINLNNDTLLSELKTVKEKKKYKSKQNDKEKFDIISLNADSSFVFMSRRISQADTLRR